MQWNVKFTKSNKLTGNAREHEFRGVDRPDAEAITGKCCGVSNVKGNSRDGPCKYDVKLTDINGAQVSLGRITGNNSLQVANLMVTSLLRGDYADNVTLEEIQNWCKLRVAELCGPHNIVQATGSQSRSVLPQVELDVTHDNCQPECEQDAITNVSEQGTAQGHDTNKEQSVAHGLSSHRKQIKRLKRKVHCLEEEVYRCRTFRKLLAKLCKDSLE